MTPGVARDFVRGGGCFTVEVVAGMGWDRRGKVESL